MGPPEQLRAPLFIAFGVLALAVSGFGSAGCGGNEYAPPPPPRVTVRQPAVQDVTSFVEYTGTTRAVESVQVRARVKGFLQSMHFDPGDFVERDDLLFIIDPEPFEVGLEAAEAGLTANQAELDLAQIEFERARSLYEEKATSEIVYIQKRANRDKAAAAVAASQSEVHAAQLDLDYAHVRAPISGRVGRHLVDIGNLVGANEPTHLTDMVRYSPVYVYFHLSERDVIAIQARTAEQRRSMGQDYENREPTMMVVGRANDEGYPYEGYIDFTALAMDADTGTFEVRGLLPNEGALDEIIVPGTFVRVRIPVGAAADALLVDERALGADQGGRFLLVVNDEDVVEQRSVEVGSRVDGMRVIAQGIERGDWVIVNGLQRARPGSKVAATRGDEATEPPAVPADG